MSSIRQQKIETAIKNELAVILQSNASEYSLGAMVSVTTIRVTRDLSLARCYLSIFAHPDAQQVLKSIASHQPAIRGVLGQRLKNMRRIPSITFHIDDSLAYADQIDKLLKE
jgi:ribosome-binding factor A